jgi:Protein of unknown function (DUF3775)
MADKSTIIADAGQIAPVALARWDYEGGAGVDGPQEGSSESPHGTSAVGRGNNRTIGSAAKPRSKVQISAEKVAHIILLAKVREARVPAWDDDRTAGDAAEEPDSILEDFADDETPDELTTFIGDLNIDEQTSLVALTWIGRATYTADQFDDAVQMAAAERITPTEVYLSRIPLLSEYLAAGMEQMGYSAISAEEDLLGSAETHGSPET